MAENDYQMALLLQQQFEHEANVDSPKNNLVYARKKKKSEDPTKSLVDPSWELIDPTPDIHILFMAFNEKYFWNGLLAVCVDWSKRMTTCAGICSYQGRGGMCRITLSEPLLKLRPRKDLIETLLHEMIHAYLFVTHNNRDRDGHGPEFHKHMYRINSEAGTNITVYHDFHDEVRLYKQHWWRCNGPCQTQKPYFGMVRRATNRAPGPNDFWWVEHQRRCGGTFIKVQEPPKVAKKKAGKENKVADSKNDIRSFYPVVNGKSSSSVATAAINGSGENKANSKNGSLNGVSGPIGASSAGTNKIMGFKDLNATRPRNALANSSSTIVINKKPTKTKKDSTQVEVKVPAPGIARPKSAPVAAFTGTGQVLGKPNVDTADYSAVRNHWLSKFPSSPSNVSKSPQHSISGPSDTLKPTKRPSSSSYASPESPKRTKPNHAEPDSDYVTCPVCQKKFPPSEVNAHLDHCLDKQPNLPQPKSKLAKCPICDRDFDLATINKHIEECLSKTFDGSEEPTDGNSKAKDLISCLVCSKRIPKGDLNLHLEECMGGDNIFNNSSVNCDDGELNDDVNAEKDGEKKYNCPVCFELFSGSEMSGHLDECLLNDSEASKDDSVLNLFFEDPF